MKKPDRTLMEVQFNMGQTGKNDFRFMLTRDQASELKKIWCNSYRCKIPFAYLNVKQLTPRVVNYKKNQ